MATADREPRVATGDPGTQAATGDPGTQAATGDPGTQAATADRVYDFCHDQVVSGGCTKEPGTRNAETRNFLETFNKTRR